MPTNNTVHPYMQGLLEAELLSGEQVVWSQQPHPFALVPESLTTFVLGIPFFAFPAFVLYHLPWQQTHWTLFLLVQSFFGLFAVFGAGMLLAPLWAILKTLRTVYAITNHRCIIIEAPYKRTIHSYYAGPGGGDIAELHRIEDSRGRGALVFHKRAWSGKRGIYYHDVGFVGIVDVREAESKIRDLIKFHKNSEIA